MLKTLVVDDEQGYRDNIQLCLSQQGCEVKTAGSGREAIELGLRYGPDVLVADWMLKSDIHGLHVSEVLRAVDPDLKTILITGFASRDLRAKAGSAQVFEFLEKPFGLDALQRAVREAGAAEQARAERLPIGVVQVDSEGTIVRANWKARELFAQTRAGADAATLSDLLAPDSRTLLSEAAQRWTIVLTDAPEPVAWHVRMREWPDAGGRLIVLLAADEIRHRSSPIIRMLLDLADAAQVRWPFEGRALIIDADQRVRRIAVESLQRTGCMCHAAENDEAGLRLFERDDGVSVVIVDHDIPGCDLRVLVERLTSVRPEVTIVGTSRGAGRDDFAAIGVTRLLQKPWSADDLINLLTDRIGTCVDCGLPLPLRRPRSGETGTSWVCGCCGSRYLAVLDDEVPHGILGNVRPAERIVPHRKPTD